MNLYWQGVLTGAGGCGIVIILLVTALLLCLREKAINRYRPAP